MTPTMPIGPEARRLRFLFETKSGATPSSGVEEYWDGDINWVTPEDLGKLGDRYVRETRRRITEEGYKNSAVSLALPGSIVLSKRAPIGQTAILAEPSTCNQGCFLLTRVNGVDERFYYYALIHLRPALEALGRGSTFMELSADDLRSVPMPFPSQVDQELIANYLDRETARIDGLIVEKERMLGLLEEKRAALISRVVTRGLDPNTPLKPSGQEWLGEIPAHWKMSRLRYLGETVLGLTFSPDDLVNEGEGVLVLRASNVKNRKIVLQDNIFVRTNIPDNLRTRPLDIVICSRSGSRALIGKNALITDETSDLTFGAFMTIFRSRLNQFLFWVFNSTLFEFQAGAFGTSTINQLTTETLANMEVPVPPPEERDAISEFLHQASNRFENAISRVSQSIDLAKERRAALITAAVTGQIPLEEMAE